MGELMYPIRRLLLVSLAISVAGSSLLPGQRRKKKDVEPETQTLELPPDPPSTLTVDSRKLAALFAPLSPKGLLSQQVRDGLRALIRSAQGAQIVKIRAMVAGTGDLRRVQSIVSEVFSDRRQSLPVLSVVQVGALPLEGAQVQLEALTQEKKIVNPHGIVFVSGQDVSAEKPAAKVLPLVQKSLEQLRTGLAGAETLRVTCFLSSLDDIQDVRAAVAAAFPGGSATFAQPQRSILTAMVECEALGRLATDPAGPVEFVNPEGLRRSESYSQVARVNAPRLVLAGTQMAFRYQEADARLAFQRLEKSLGAAGAGLKNAVMVNSYPLSPQLADLIRKVRFDFLDKSRPPASTMLPFEGLPGMDASFGLEVVAVIP